MTTRTRQALGLLGGLLVLGLMVAFAVGLPKISDGGSHGGSEAGEDRAAAVLPDSLPGDLLAVDSGQLPEELTAQLSDPDELVTVQEETSVRITDLFGAPSAFRIYASADASRLAIVTVLDKEPGLFVPDGPPVETGDAATAPAYQLLAVDGAVCSQYGSAEPGTIDPSTGQPASTRSHCQLGADGRTYDMDAQGMTPDDVVAALRSLAETA